MYRIQKKDKQAIDKTVRPNSIGSNDSKNPSFFNFSQINSYIKPYSTFAVSVAASMYSFFGTSTAESMNFQEVLLHSNNSNYIKLDLAKNYSPDSGYYIRPELVAALENITAQGYQLVTDGINLPFDLIKEIVDNSHQILVRIYEEHGKHDSNIKDVISVFEEAVKSVYSNNWALIGAFAGIAGVFLIGVASTFLWIYSKNSKCCKSSDYTQIPDTSTEEKAQFNFGKTL